MPVDLTLLTPTGSSDDITPEQEHLIRQCCAHYEHNLAVLKQLADEDRYQTAADIAGQVLDYLPADTQPVEEHVTLSMCRAIAWDHVHALTHIVKTAEIGGDIKQAIDNAIKGVAPEIEPRAAAFIDDEGTAHVFTRLALLDKWSPEYTQPVVRVEYLRGSGITSLVGDMGQLGFSYEHQAMHHSNPADWAVFTRWIGSYNRKDADRLLLDVTKALADNGVNRIMFPRGAKESVASPYSILLPYYSNDYDRNARRTRNLNSGIDVRLLACADNYETASEEQETLIRRASYHYGQSIKNIRGLAEQGQYQQAQELAMKALAYTPHNSPLRNGPHDSLRMCAWIAEDYFRHLAFIADSDEHDMQAVIDKRLSKAFAKMGLR